MMSLIKKLNIKSKRKGSATVEAAMIFPLIMFIIFGIIYLTIVHYQNNVMIAESIRAVNRAGSYYQYLDMDVYGKPIKSDSNSVPAAFDNSIPKDGIINADMIKNRNPYRTIVDLLSEGISKIFNVSFGMKKNSATRYLKARIKGIKFKQYRNKNNVYEGYDEDGDKISDVKGSGFILFGDDLYAELDRTYINPLQGLSKSFFGDDSIMDSIKHRNIIPSGVISNQAEFVRNLDTIYDIGINAYNLIKTHKVDDYD